MRDILRMQGTLAFFVFLYLNQVIYPSSASLEDILFHIQHLEIDEKMLLMGIIEG